MDIELPLEVQARLASLSHEIRELDICELQKLFMQLAHKNAEQQQVYSTMLNQVTRSERNCYRKLEHLERTCEEYRTILSEFQ
jgi:t-SNARE complex subunit (syntaxin)